MKSLQVLKPHYRIQECLDEIKECLEIGWTGMGYKTVQFEEKWKEYSGLDNAHFLNSATSGLHLAVKIMKDKHGWAEGDEIITTAFTFVSTNHAILYEKLRPVFADIDESLNIDIDSVLSKITDRTKAIIFVGIGGNTKNLLEIISIAREKGLKIILDAAHMAGSKIDGKHVGFGVDVSVFSFQAVKNLPTADSGMICFGKNEFDDAARRLSWLGISKDTFLRSGQGNYKWDYDVVETGYKYHGNSVMAAMGIVGLKYLDDDNEYRNSLAKLYADGIGRNLNFINHEEGSSRHLFQVVVDNRNEVINYLSDRGIFTGVHYKSNMEYRMYDKSILKNVNFYSNRILSLPLHLGIVESDVEFIVSELLKVAK